MKRIKVLTLQDRRKPESDSNPLTLREALIDESQIVMSVFGSQYSTILGFTILDNQQFMIRAVVKHGDQPHQINVYEIEGAYWSPCSDVGCVIEVLTDVKPEGM